MNEYTLNSATPENDAARITGASSRSLSDRRSRGDAPLLVVAPMPPPVMGQSLATERLVNILADKGLRIKIADTAPVRKKSLQSHFIRLIRLFWAPISAIIERLRGSRSIYISVLANVGIFHTAICALLARLLGYRVFLHHHVSSYTKSYKPKMAFLAACAGPKAIHITLCEAMSEDLKRNYRFVQETMAISNAIFIPRVSAPKRRSSHGIRCVGHISGLMIEKGLQRLINLFRSMKPHESGVELLIAGSAYTPIEQEIVDDAKKEFGKYIQHFGHVGGREKEEFFEKIDVFIFPSLYPHEAAPLVCLEAMTAGVPFIAHDWGYVKSATGAAGAFIDPNEPFEEHALKILERWNSQPEELQKNSDRVREAFDQLTAESNSQINALIKLIRSA